MVTLNKIYTKTGDGGDTGVVTGERLPKTHPRIVAIGDVDELNAAIGVAMGHALGDELMGMLLAIQNDLFDLGADLATPKTLKGELRLDAGRIGRLEEMIDALNESLPPLESFVLPSGPGGAGALHLARAIARRAERSVWALKDDGGEVSGPVPTFLNRLSDFLFVAARKASRNGGGEVLWVPGGAKDE
ncbi:cob(I)yrinic acid a,c-diamide adenosyltransferase [Parvularcula sp. ZS-1/3]|uniref:Corrinoid adenosyltransferase n=1 Tax=Parvularcula mediterranea TaxID=2732508 RepID=A0A7Y3RKS1_9PROT|nr:cob(I)yrinic acid a,c-diamide adenosyltransferase [Parvularcula mediterranea]NNU15177.1 cob(I)yrinic acid a,c-diamide adenosyltransferase [Parvularcula mediterranea]